jgi:L-2-hydroxyglutarate oxidase LhgO
MQKVDCIVAGAGVIGLATTRALALRDREVVLLEANSVFGSETSSRNNEVIHAGFLHPPGSLKARLCREGRDLLYDYSLQHGIPHRRIGKLVIATNDNETGILRGLVDQAPQHGVTDLEWLDGRAAQRMEPRLHCSSAALSPSTGIIDAHALMLALLGDAENAGAAVAYATRVVGYEVRGPVIVVRTIDKNGEPYDLSCRTFINAAGLGANAIARSERDRRARIPTVTYSKGNFFALSGPLPFQRVIMPLGDTLTAGGAFTIDMGQQGKFGPDVELVDNVDYAVDPSRIASCVGAVRRYYPEVDVDAIQPGYAGVRPQVLAAPIQPPDWVILGPMDNGVSGLFHLLGFDSPGLTGCLAIADHVAAAAVDAMEGLCPTTAS